MQYKFLLSVQKLMSENSVLQRPREVSNCVHSAEQCCCRNVELVGRPAKVSSYAQGDMRSPPDVA